MKICFISMEWPPYSGGIATYTYAAASSLIDAGHEVVVITSDIDSVLLDGVDIHLVPEKKKKVIFPKLRKWKMEPFDRWSKDVFEYFLSQFKPDYFDIIEAPEYGAWARMLTELNTPIITRCHNSTRVVWSINCKNRNNYSTVWGIFQDRKERRQTYCSAGITAPSYSYANYISLQWNIERSLIKVIPNCIDTDIFSPAKLQYSNKNQREILYIGRFQYGKGVYDFLNAIIPVLEKYSDVSVRFVGRDMPAHDVYSQYGDTATEIINNLITPRVSDRVVIDKPVKQIETVDLYRNAYCVVIPTRGYESFSYTCLEAMACGCAIIATKCGGPTELISNGSSGLLVEPGNVLEIRDAIVKLLDNNDLKEEIGIVARRLAEENYSMRNIAKETIRYYEDIMRARDDGLV